MANKKPRPMPAGFTGSTKVADSTRAIAPLPADRGSRRLRGDPAYLAHGTNIVPGRYNVKACRGGWR
jgi:hypothetical protein